MSKYRKKKPSVPYCYRPYEAIDAQGGNAIYHPWVIDTCLPDYQNPFKVAYSINLYACDDEVAKTAYKSCAEMGIGVALCQTVRWGEASITGCDYKLQFATELEWAAAMFVI